MTIEGGQRGALRDGARLVAKYKGVQHEATVVVKDGATRYRLADGAEYKSTSSAARAITGASVNGWKFWSIAE